MRRHRCMRTASVQFLLLGSAVWNGCMQRYMCCSGAADTELNDERLVFNGPELRLDLTRVGRSWLLCCSWQELRHAKSPHLQARAGCQDAQCRTQSNQPEADVQRQIDGS